MPSNTLLEPASKGAKRKPSSKLASGVSSLSSRSTLPESCPYCGSDDLSQRLVTRSYGRGANLLIIESIPSTSCGNCGESFFTAATMHEIERVKNLRGALAVKRSVAVASFG